MVLAPTDSHTPGLRAQPWWVELPAIAALEAQADTLAAEFEAVLALEGS